MSMLHLITRYIRSISIKKKSGASLREVWFDNELPLNSGLVAIIGNKGKGKSALADTIGLLGNTRQYRAFSFLSTNSFRNPRDNKARFFEAALTWESGTPTSASLDSMVDETQPELIKYMKRTWTIKPYLNYSCHVLRRQRKEDKYNTVIIPRLVCSDALELRW